MTAERFSPCPHDLVVPEERAAGKLAKGTRGQLRGAKPGAGKGKGMPSSGRFSTLGFRPEREDA